MNEEKPKTVLISDLLIEMGRSERVAKEHGPAVAYGYLDRGILAVIQTKRSENDEE